MRTPDDLDRRLRLTTPALWGVVGVCLAILLGIAGWAVFARITSTVSAQGLLVKQEVHCYFTEEEVRQLEVGDKAEVEGKPMTVTAVADVPEQKGLLLADVKSDFLFENLMPEAWGYEVTLTGSVDGLPANEPLDVRIVTGEVSPISLVLGS